MMKDLDPDSENEAIIRWQSSKASSSELFSHSAARSERFLSSAMKSSNAFQYSIVDFDIHSDTDVGMSSNVWNLIDSPEPR